MPTPLVCANCGVTLTTQDALSDQVVQDDEGFHHRECIDDGSPTRSVSVEELAAAERMGDLTPEQIQEENEARRDHGDPPLDLLTRRFPCKEFSVAKRPLCPECGVNPGVAGGRCSTCRGRSML